MPNVFFMNLNRKTRVVLDNFYYRVEHHTYRGWHRICSFRDADVACSVCNDTNWA